MNTMPHSTVFAAGERAREVEATLNDLRDKHRLAVHMWENSESSGNCVHSHAWLARVKAENMPAMLAARTMPLQSMTLMPSSKAEKPIVPYAVAADNIKSFGYLIDLDQERSDAASVLRAGQGNLNSGVNPRFKNAKLTLPTGNVTLDALYAPFNGGTMHYSMAERGRELTKAQLDAIGSEIEAMPMDMADRIRRDVADEIYHIPNTIPHNEILVASTAEHIRAIVFPRTDSAHAPLWQKPINELNMAIAGLANLGRGLDVPVVIYDVTGNGAGAFTYFAEGREALLRKARQAIAELEGPLKLWPTYKNAQPEQADALATATRTLCDHVMGGELSTQAQRG